MTNFDAAHIAQLDRAYSTPQILDQRRRFRAIIAAHPSEIGLDVGCGPGHLACELAREVAPGGRIVAIDNSPQSVGATKARVTKEELADSVNVRVGDATALEFPNDTFDFVIAAQVYSFVPNVAQRSRKQRGCFGKAVGCWYSSRIGICVFGNPETPFSLAV
jgi:ubiquinone/menaquinone biosynthesis C-methylase UbiE